LGTSTGILKKVSQIIFIKLLTRYDSRTLSYFLLFIIKKVLLSSAIHAVNYEELVLDNGNAILPDTSLTTNGEHLYVLTRSNVSFYLNDFN